MKKLTVVLLLLGLALAAQGAAISAAQGAAEIRVFTSILPQEFFVEKVGGPYVSVESLVSPGQEPHTFEPTPQQLVRLAQSPLFFRIGLPFEKRLLEKIAGSFPNLRVVDLRQGIKLIPMTGLGQDEHGDEGMDPHIWLDPKRVKIMAAVIAYELGRLDPPHQAEFQKNLAAFQQELAQVDAEITALLTPFRGRAFLVFHPAYGYFAESYGLTQIAVEEGGRSPGPRQIARWVETARKNRVQVVFVQPQFSAAAAQAIAEGIGGTVVPLDPLARDYLDNLRRIAQAIAGAMAP